MTWPHRYFVVVGVSDVTDANTAAASVDPAGGGAATFGVCALSPDGKAPATHYGCSIAATDEMRAGMMDALGSISSAYFWRLESTNWTLVDSNLPESLPFIGDSLTFDEAASHAGLRRILLDDEPEAP